jgi:hypothetical protein
MCAHFRIDDLNIAPNGSGVELHIDRYTVKSRLQPVSFGINGGASIESVHSFGCSGSQSGSDQQPIKTRSERVDAFAAN